MKAELVIDRLSQLGEGVSTFGGRTVFVEGAWPGERVFADVHSDGKVQRGRLLSIVEASPARRAAACGVADRCGGCDWLGLSEAAQRAAKEEIVLSALEHVGRIPRESLEIRPYVMAPEPLAYRRRAVLHMRNGVLGFFERGSHITLPISRCPALVPGLQDKPGLLSQALGPIAEDCDRVHLLASGKAWSFAVSMRRALTPRHRKVVTDALRPLGASGAVLLPKTGAPALLGEPLLRASAPHAPKVSLWLRPDGFAQAHDALTESLVGAALGLAGLRSSDQVLELYAGHGAFTFALARHAAGVMAVEEVGSALELARRSATEGKVTNARFVRGESAPVCKGLAQEGKRFDVVLLDPPRAGAPGLAKHLRTFAPRTIVYVACDAAALSRDAAALQEQGYQPAAIQCVDMFPQTRHIEAVMSFVRS